MMRSTINQARPRRVRTLLLFVVMLLLLAGTLSAAQAASTSAIGSASIPARFAGVFIGITPNFGSTIKRARLQFVVIQSTDAGEIRSLRAANPAVKILVYMNPFLARPSDPLGESVCSTLRGLQGAGQAWLLRDQHGNIVQDKNQPTGNYLMDPGNTSYQESCVSHAIELAKAIGANGIYWDDINASDTWYLNRGVTIPEYPAEASWQNAETSFLSYATAQAHANGLMDFANLGGAGVTKGLWDRWDRLLDGAEEQSWNDWAAGGAYGVSKHFETLLAEPVWSEAHGRYTILESDDDGEQQNTFGLATMMLAANGRTSYCEQIQNAPFYPTYAAAQGLGAPLGRYVALKSGLYERRFAHGMVLVNPTTRNRYVRLPRVMVNSASGFKVRKLVVTAMTGYILRTH